MLPRGDRGLELYRQPESDSPDVVVHLHLEALVVLPPRAWSADLPGTPQELSRSNLQLQRLWTDPLLVLPAFQPVGVPAGLQFQCHPHGCRIPGAQLQLLRLQRCLQRTPRLRAPQRAHGKEQHRGVFHCSL
jgi:hypothetical protein